jgi:L-ascorbate metabolism protein UlaG (beta-lactamase superfamily)
MSAENTEEHGSSPAAQLRLDGSAFEPQLTSGSLTFIGTATVLARCGGFTFLTDPNFLHQGDHAKLGYGLRSRRLTEPAMSIDELPPLDFVVLSHHHGDHFDDVAAERLDRDLPIFTGPHAARKLARQGFRRAHALSTWQTAQVERPPARVLIHATPGRHAPGPLQRALPPVMGSVLEFSAGGPASLRMYITGDTLFFPGLGEVASRFARVDICLLHLGGTRVAGVLLTMDADQGVRLLRLIRPARAIPIHYDDYTVFKSGLDEFRRAADAADLPTEVVYLDRGDTFTFPIPTA